MYPCGWFMLMLTEKKQNSVKQLSFIKNIYKTKKVKRLKSKSSNEFI